MTISWAPWLIWILPAIGFIVTPLFARVNHRSSNYVAVTSIGLSFLFSLTMTPTILVGNVVEQHVLFNPFEISLLLDPLNVIMCCVVSGLGFTTALYSLKYLSDKSNAVRFWCLTQGFIAGYLMTVISGNLLLTFIGWQILSLCVIGLAFLEHRESEKTTNGLKSFLFLRVGDIFFLVAIKIVKDSAGTLNIIELQRVLTWLGMLSQMGLLPIIILSLLIGIMIKTAQFPLRKWLNIKNVTSPEWANTLTGLLVAPYLIVRVIPIFCSAYTAGDCQLPLSLEAIVLIGVIAASLIALTMTANNLLLDKFKERIIMFTARACEKIEMDSESLNNIANRIICFSRATHQYLEHGFNSLNLLFAKQVVDFAKVTQQSLEGSFDRFTNLFASKVLSLAEISHSGVEQNLDSLNHFIATRITRLSNIARFIHTGVLSYNMSAVLFFILLISIILLMLGGFLS